MQILEKSHLLFSMYFINQISSKTKPGYIILAWKFKMKFKNANLK